MSDLTNEPRLNPAALTGWAFFNGFGLQLRIQY